MRPIAVFVLALSLAGCGKKTPREWPDEDVKPTGTGVVSPDPVPPVRAAEAPPRPRPEAARPRQPKAAAPETVDMRRIIDDYDSQSVRAEVKYKGKRGRITATAETVGQDAKGVPFIGTTNLANETINPNLMWRFPVERLGEVAAVERGKQYILEGTCAGVVRDGISRGGFSGRYDWRIEMIDCQVIGPVGPP